LSCGATAYHTLKILIYGYPILAFVYQLAHRVTYVYLAGEDNKSLQGTVPEGLILMLKGVPREEAIAIGQQQAVYTQVTTYCHQSIILTQVRVWKPQILI
jgi:hypothetical protein